MREGKAIAYESNINYNQTQNKFVYERELMAIGLTVKNQRHLLGLEAFCGAYRSEKLRFLVGKRIMGEDQEWQKWVSKLSGLDFEVKYRTNK